MNEFHKRSPWIQLPIAFNKIGNQSTLICGKFDLADFDEFKVYETIKLNNNLIRSIFEPILAFKIIFKERPRIVMISPIGSYLFTILPLIFMTKLLLFKKNRPKFLLKSDWNLDYSGLSFVKRTLLNTLFEFSSRIFDFVTIETYCGVYKAKKLPLVCSDNIVRFPIGFPSNFMSIRKYDNGKRKKIVLCVARIARMKDQLTLIKAFGKVSKSIIDWKLILSGPIEDSEYMNEINEEIRVLGISESIEFTGFLEEKQLLHLYEKASIFCLPSRFLESAGQVKYEAIASGIPVISSDVPCREDNEELGIMVFNAGDYEDLAKNIKILMENEELRKEYSINSQLKLKSYEELVLDLYNNFICKM